MKEYKEHLSKYLKLDKQIKELKEEQDLHKEALTLALVENKTDRINIEDLGQVKLVAATTSEIFDKKMAEKYLAEDIYNKCFKTSKRKSYVKIQSAEALEASRKFLEAKSIGKLGEK